MNKSDLRKILIAKRQAIPLIERLKAAQSAADQLSQHSLFKNNKNFGAYLARKDEFDCMPIIKTIWQHKKNCFLPILGEQPRVLNFVGYQPNDALHFNKFKIEEPDCTVKINLNELDIVITPLVGFDLQGHRLGLGGGFYDKTFGGVEKKKKPLLIGLAFECQKLESLPFDEWDVPLSGVITEERVYLF